MALKKYLYESGEWNDFNPYSYDFECDQNNIPVVLESSKLSTYLKTRRGTCVSMPMLFFVLLRRAGKGVYIANAPTPFFENTNER